MIAQRARVSSRGFTLLEVLVALAILGVAVVASIQGFAQGLRLLKLAGDHQDAMLLADQKVREVVAPEEGREEGTEERFQWTRTIEKVPTPELSDLTRPNPWTLYRVDVRVHWDAAREIHLATLKMMMTLPVLQTGAPTAPGTTPPGATPPGTTPPGGTPPGTSPSGPTRPGAPRPGQTPR